MAIQSGRVKGLPLREFIAEKADIVALSELEAGMIAFATDTLELGFYTGSAWIWMPFGHSVLSDMPDTPGGNTDHDTRYVMQVSATPPTVPTPFNGMMWLNTALSGPGYGEERYGFRTIFAPETLLATDRWVRFDGTFTVTLPAAELYPGKPYDLKNVGTGIITLVVDGGGTIEDETSQKLYSKDSVRLASNGTQWEVL